MQFLKNFYLTNVRHQLINKFVYKKIAKLPKFKKVELNLESKTTDTKMLFSGLLAFELITNQKGLLTTINTSITFQIRKGNLAGCKLTLQKNNLFRFFTEFLLNITPKIKINRFNLNKNSFSCKIKEILTLWKLETHYYFFNHLSNLNLTLVMTTNSKKEIMFFYKLLYLL